MARHAAPDLLRHADRGADLPRRAVAALESVVLDERPLQRMERTAGREPLDRGHRPPVVLDRQGEARQDPLAVDQHRAGTARALVAPLLGAMQPQAFTEVVEQRHARIVRQLLGRAIDDDRQRLEHGLLVGLDVDPVGLCGHSLSSSVNGVVPPAGRNRHVSLLATSSRGLSRPLDHGGSIVRARGASLHESGDHRVPVTWWAEPAASTP